jgi:hypothetical protein
MNRFQTLLSILPCAPTQWLLAAASGEAAESLHALRFKVASLERRLAATVTASAAAAGPACAAALNDALDARKDAESRGAAVEVELDAARNLSAAAALRQWAGACTRSHSSST